MTEYKVVCAGVRNGSPTHPERLLGILIDRRGPFDAEAAMVQLTRLRDLSRQLLPGQEQDDADITKVIRGDALMRARIQYRVNGNRTTAAGGTHHTSSEDSISARLVRRGREWSFWCKTCATSGKGAVLLSDAQVEQIVDVLAAGRSRGLEISGRRALT